MRTILPLILILASCGGRPDARPVADRGAGGLHPVPDAQVFASAPVERPPRGDVDVGPQVGGDDSPGAPTPEPASVVLLAAGLAVLGLSRRRRRG